MNPFNLFYLVMLVLLVIGTGVSMLTPLGGDERIGNIAAGFSVGLLLATVAVRFVQLRVNRMSVEGKLDFHGLQTGIAAPSMAFRDRQPRKIEIVDSGGETAEPAKPSEPPHAEPIRAEQPRAETARAEATLAEQPRSNVVDFQNPDWSQFGDEPIQQAAPVYEGPMCTCVCRCGRPAEDGFEGMCSECRSERLENMLVCDCNYASTKVCICGAVSHWPVEPKAEV